MAICRKPWISPTGEILPCGQCPECLVNRKQIWVNRNILESYGHVQKSFVTLTYSDENLPKNHLGINTLEKTHLQTFFKNLRSKLSGSIRYYAVGEYGTSGERGINPHFHVLLYGADQTATEEINDAWRLPAGRGKKGELAGYVYVGDITDQSIAYVAGYVEKKTAYNRDMYDDLQITPEYSVMSKRPTIGASAIPKLVDFFKKNPDYLTVYGDVPYSIMHGERRLPLGQYMREKIRQGLDLPHDVDVYMDETTGLITERKIWHGKEEAKAQRKAEMQILQKNSKDSPAHDPKLDEDARVSVKKFYQYKNSQSFKNFDAAERLKTKNYTL